MRCVIIGAAGFIGSRLSTFLASQGDEVLGVDVIEPPSPSPADAQPMAFARCDVARDPIPVPSGVDAVYYLSQSPLYREFPDRIEEVFQVNALGAMRAARAAAEAGASMFLYASTGNVYTPSFEPIPESRAIRRDDPYALSKVHGEELLSLLDAAGEGAMRIVHARLFGVFGPGQRAMLVPKVIERIRAGEPVILQPRADDPADRDGLRISLRYVGDLVSDLRGLPQLEFAGPINLAGDEAVSIRRLAEEIASALGTEVSFTTAKQSRETDFIADISRMQSLLSPTFTSLSRAIAATVNIDG